MPERPKPHTHTAYLYKRVAKKQGVLLECGTGRIDKVRNTAELFLDRTPIGGWTGYVHLAPHNVLPPPQREDESDEVEQESEE